MSDSTSGAVLIVLMLATVFAGVLALALLSTYKRRMKYWASQTSEAQVNGEWLEAAPTRESDSGSLLARIGEGQRRCVLAYTMAAVACSFALTMAFVAELEKRPLLTFATVFVLNLCPLVLAAELISAWHTRLRWRYRLGYLGALVFLAGMSWAFGRNVGLGGLLAMLVLIAGIPYVLLRLLLMRRVRALGVTTLAFALFVVGVPWIFLSAGATNRPTANFIAEIGMFDTFGALGAVVVACVIGLLVSAGISVLVVRVVVYGYERRWVSDQMMLTHAVWFLFVLFQVIIVGSEPKGSHSVAWLLLAFPFYLVTLQGALRVLKTKESEAQPRPVLLVLRSFALKNRALDVFEPVTMLWRFAGPVVLIGGPDFAGATIQPAALLQFVSRGLRSSFVHKQEDFRLQLNQVAQPPDLDGRYRITEFRCFMNTWEKAVQGLMPGCAVILADFRGLDAAVQAGRSTGVQLEIGHLAKQNAFDRCVFLLESEADRLQVQKLAGLVNEGPALRSIVAREANYATLQRVIDAVLLLPTTQSGLGADRGRD